MTGRRRAHDTASDACTTPPSAHDAATRGSNVPAPAHDTATREGNAPPWLTAPLCAGATRRRRPPAPRTGGRRTPPVAAGWGKAVRRPHGPAGEEPGGRRRGGSTGSPGGRSDGVERSGRRATGRREDEVGRHHWSATTATAGSHRLGCKGAGQDQRPNVPAPPRIRAGCQGRRKDRRPRRACRRPTLAKGVGQGRWPGWDVPWAHFGGGAG